MNLRCLAAVAGAGTLAVGFGGCSHSLPESVNSAPVLSVATGLWPLAQMASMIGGDKVAVEDVVPVGANPLTFQPSSQVADELRSAGLVLEVGGGFQSGLESAASGAPSVTALRTRLGVSNPYVWLDPPTMARAVSAIVAAMSAADPQAAPLFRTNASGVSAQLQSLGIDYSSTFSACPGNTIVTPDQAFATMANDYQLHDRVIGPDPSPAAVASVVSDLPANSRAAGISEPWVDNSGVTAASRPGHFSVHQVDTLASTPTTAGNYFSQMEQVLGQVSGDLGCSSQEQ